MNVRIRFGFACALVAVLFIRCQPNQHTGKTISATDVYDIIYDSVQVSQYIVLDVRSRMEYIRGHLVSAMWLNSDLVSEKLAVLSNEKRPLIIYGADDTQISAMSNVLLENGVSNFYVMKGGFTKWTQLGFPAAIQLVRNTDENITTRRRDITIAAAHALLNNLISDVALIDVREYPAFAEAHIERAKSVPYVPLNEFVVGIEEQNFPRNKPIIIYCDALSNIGEKATEVMLRNDFTQIYLLRCDVAEWDLAQTQSAPVSYR
jgi:rhodanese-related sulfurtransferase